MKIFERLFMARIQPHLINSPNYNPLMSAYRTGHSTETALLTLLNKARLSADWGIHASRVTGSQCCLRLNWSFNFTSSTSLNVWCRWQCSNVAWVLTVSEGPIGEIWSGCLLHNPAQNRCSSGFGSWTNSVHFLHLRHSIRHQSVQCWPTTICRWHPSFHLLIKK